MPRKQPADAQDDEVTLRLQREVNERLVLAALQSQEDADDAAVGRVQAERETRELRAREEELRETAELRERLIGIIGHDLRDPLNMMTMACGLLLSRGHLTDEDGRLVSRMVSTSQRMKRMIDQLVEFTRARLGGGYEFHPVDGDLGIICNDVADELRIGSKIEILQTSIGDLTGRWDADRLVEALMNLASNAVEHAEAGTPVEIHAREEPEGVLVEVTNRGASIPPHVLPFIFDAFHSTEKRATSKSGHLGLGLYIACELVKAQGGSLRVRSSEGTTTFSLRLPRGLLA